MADDTAPDEALLAEADPLYALAPGEFTAARDARAKQLKPDDAALAAAVKGLRRPSVAAWLVNQLVRREAAQVGDVLSVGEALREAQSQLSADDLRALTRQRRQLTAAVTTRARALGRELGQKVSEAVAEQVEATLTAAMLDAGAAAAVRSGLLVAALRSTGLDAVDVDDALAVPGGHGHVATVADDADGPAGGPGPDGPALRVVPDPDAGEKLRAAARERLAAAQGEVDELDEALGELAEEIDDLEARGMQAQARVDELRRRLAEAEEQQGRIEDLLTDAEEGRAEHAERLAAATAERDAAQAALDAVDATSR